jgi:hypothetical protein
MPPFFSTNQHDRNPNMMQKKLHATLRRQLNIQHLEDRRLLAADLDDQIVEAIPAVYGTANVGEIDNIDDVDMWSISLTEL